MLLWTLMYMDLFGSLLSVLFSMFLGYCPVQFYILPGELGGLVTSFSCFWQRFMLLFPFMLLPVIYTWGMVTFHGKEKSGSNNSETRNNEPWVFCLLGFFLPVSSISERQWLPLTLGQRASRNPQKILSSWRSLWKLCKWVTPCKWVILNIAGWKPI